VLLDPAAPWPTDGILCWLGLVIADHIPACPDVLVRFLITSLFILVVLALVSLLFRPYFRNQIMDNTCLPYDDRTMLSMDVDVEEQGKNEDSAKCCRNSEERAIGLPFPGALLADGTFAIEYHNM
jgi:hypothetical protein